MSIALLYFLNLWSAERLIHVWIWVAYAILPLYVYFGLACILNKGSKYLVAYSLLFGIYGVIPHNFIYMFVLHIFLSIFSLTPSNKKNPKSLFLFIGISPIIYILTNMPLFLLLFMAKGLEYPIPMSIDQLIMLSRNGNLINIFTFSNNWWPRVPATLLKNPSFRITSLILFTMAFSATLIKTKREYKVLALLSSVFIIGLIFFAQGANNPILLGIIYVCGQLGRIDIFAPSENGEDLAF